LNNVLLWPPVRAEEGDTLLAPAEAIKLPLLEILKRMVLDDKNAENLPEYRKVTDAFKKQACRSIRSVATQFFEAFSIEHFVQYRENNAALDFSETSDYYQVPKEEQKRILDTFVEEVIKPEIMKGKGNWFNMAEVAFSLQHTSESSYLVVVNNRKSIAEKLLIEAVKVGIVKVAIKGSEEVTSDDFLTPRKRKSKGGGGVGGSRGSSSKKKKMNEVNNDPDSPQHSYDDNSGFGCSYHKMIVKYLDTHKVSFLCLDMCMPKLIDKYRSSAPHDFIEDATQHSKKFIMNANQEVPLCIVQEMDQRPVDDANEDCYYYDLNAFSFFGAIYSFYVFETCGYIWTNESGGTFDSGLGSAYSNLLSSKAIDGSVGIDGILSFEKFCSTLHKELEEHYLQYLPDEAAKQHDTGCCLSIQAVLKVFQAFLSSIAKKELDFKKNSFADDILTFSPMSFKLSCILLGKLLSVKYSVGILFCDKLSVGENNNSNLFYSHPTNILGTSAIMWKGYPELKSCGYYSVLLDRRDDGRQVFAFTYVNDLATKEATNRLIGDFYSALFRLLKETESSKERKEELQAYIVKQKAEYLKFITEVEKKNTLHGGQQQNEHEELLGSHQHEQLVTSKSQVLPRNSSSSSPSTEEIDRLFASTTINTPQRIKQPDGNIKPVGDSRAAEETIEPKSCEVIASASSLLATEEKGDEETYQQKSSEVITSASSLLATEEKGDEETYQQKSCEVIASASSLLATEEKGDEETYQQKSCEVIASASSLLATEEKGDEETYQQKSCEVIASASSLLATEEKGDEETYQQKSSNGSFVPTDRKENRKRKLRTMNFVEAIDTFEKEVVLIGQNEHLKELWKKLRESAQKIVEIVD